MAIKKTTSSSGLEPMVAEHPSARYFQIHFEHIQGQLLETRLRMEDLQKQMAEILFYVGQQEPVGVDKAIRMRGAKRDTGVAKKPNWPRNKTG